MQVGCCIRRALTSLGTVTAVALLAATGIAGDEVVTHDGRNASSSDNTVMNDAPVKLIDKAEFYRRAEEKAGGRHTMFDMGTINADGIGPAPIIKSLMTAPSVNAAIARGVGPGADCANATNIDGLLAAGTVGSATIAGDTTGAPYIAAPASDPALPGVAGCGGTFSEFEGGGGQWWSLTGTGNDFSFAGCTSGFDTTFSVFTGDCVTGLTCAGGDDDACGGPTFQSQGTFSTTLGTEYLILVCGFEAAEGAYSFDITELVPMTVDCSMADQGELLEPMCQPGAGESDPNGGCFLTTPIFEELLLNGQVCGTLGATSGVGRDADGYRITVPGPDPLEVTITVEGTGGFLFIHDLIQDDGDPMTPVTITCATVGAEQVPWGDATTITSLGGEAITGTACLLPGEYSVGLLTGSFDNVICGDIDNPEVTYSITVTSGPCVAEACCMPDGTCADMLSAECVADGGVVFADTDCATLDLDNGANPACNGFCCVLEDDMMGGFTASIEQGFSQAGCETLIGSNTARAFFGYNLTMEEEMDAFCEPIANNVSCAAADPVLTDGTIVFGDTRTSTYVIDPSVNPELPGSGCGTAYVSDADTGAPFGLWYTFTGTGETVDISLCGNVLPEDEYDGKIWVFCGDCSCLFCNDGDDDGCSFFGPSEVTGLCTEMGTTYYVLVGGFATPDAGMFGLSVTSSGMMCDDAVSCVLCDVVCTPDDETIFAEFNEDCLTPPGVEANDGCINDTAAGVSFSSEVAFLGDTICGNIGARDGVVDSDWYLLDNDTGLFTQVTVTLTSEAPAALNLYNYLGNTGDVLSDAMAPANCDNVDVAGPVIDSMVTGNCEAPAEIVICLGPGTWFFEVVGNATRTACMKDEYSLTFVDNGPCATGSCCLTDGTCSDGVTEIDCLTVLGGFFTVDGVCADNMGDITCMGYCCTLADTPGSANDCTTTDFDTCTTDPNFLVWGGIETTCADKDADCGTRPVNDNCDGALAIDTMGTALTADLGSNNTDNDVYYTFTGTGNEVTVSLCGSTEDPLFDPDTANGRLSTFLNIFCRGCEGDGVEGLRFVAGGTGADDCVMGETDGPNEVTFCTEAGTDYLIEAGIFLGEGGTVEVTVTDSGMACSDSPDCSPVGACCTDSMTADCVITTQRDCEETLLGTFAGEGTDCGGDTFVVSLVPDIDAVEIGPTTTALVQTPGGEFALLDDEAYATIAMPFDFPFLGQTITAGSNIYMNVNGFLTFDADMETTTENLYVVPAGGIPDPGLLNNLIAPQWGDFITNAAPGNGLFFAVDDNGTPGDDTDDTAIFEWNVGAFGGTTTVTTFQAILSQDGTICFVFDSDLGFGTDFNGANPLFGAEGPDGLFGINVLTQTGFAVTDKIVLTPDSNPLTCPIVGEAMGACCIDGVCSIMTQADCESTIGVNMVAGIYGGDDTVCGTGEGEISCNDCFYDTNNDGLVDIIDFGAFGTAFGSSDNMGMNGNMSGIPDANFDPALDSNGDGLIDIIDFGLFGMEFNRTDCQGSFVGVAAK